MKISISLALLSVFALASCEIDEPPPQKRRPAPRYPSQQTSQYPPQPQPFSQPSAPSSSASSGPVSAPASQPENNSDSAPASAPASSNTAKGDFPYGVPVPGKPGFVRSPFSPDKMTDVRGYAPGTEVKDPYHPDKTFLVP